MADNLLDNYNPLYDIHLRQYFALPHMQKHLQKMGLLESTLNLNGDEVYARHHAMMDMMLKNREAQLVKMAELRKKLDAAEKVEICRRIRTGQSPESYRRGKPSRSLSRSRANQKGGAGGRQRRFSNSYEDRDFVQNIEEKNADPEDYDTRDPYKRLSANAKRFNYLHKLDDKTLIAYKDNLKQQLQRLERFREISFGPHSVARQPPPPQASWFFRRRSVLNMRGRKTTTGNKLNASHDSRTSCPPTTRKRKDSNSRLPPINPKSRVPTKPPAPLVLQQTTTKLPPAAKKPAPNRGRPSNKRQTTTTTTTTITSMSKSPQNPTTLPTLPAVTGHGIFTGAAAAATVAAIGTSAINVGSLISNEHEKTPSPPVSPVLETQKTFDRSSPMEQLPSDVLDNLADESEQVNDSKYKDDDEVDEHIAREVVLDNTPIGDTHGDYEDSDSEPEYAEEDRVSSPEETYERPEVQITHTADTPVVEYQQVSPPISEKSLETTQDDDHINDQTVQNEYADETSSPAEKHEEISENDNVRSSSVLSEENNASSKHSVQDENKDTEPFQLNEQLETMENTGDNLETDVSERFEVQHLSSVQANKHEFTEQNDNSSLDRDDEIEATQHPVFPVETSIATEMESQDIAQNPELSVENSHAVEHFEEHDAVPQSPVISIHGVEIKHEEAPQSPVLSIHSSEHENGEQNQKDQEVDHFANSSIIDESSGISVMSRQHEAAVDVSKPTIDLSEKSPSPQREKSPVNSNKSENFDDLSGSDIQQHDDVAHLQMNTVENESHDALTNSEELKTDLPEENTDSARNVFTKPTSPIPSEENTHEIDHHADFSESHLENSFVPRSPSVHTSDASDHENEAAFEKIVDDVTQHSNEHISVNHEETTASELYNPSNGNMESPAISDDEHGDVQESTINVSASPISQTDLIEENHELSQEQGMTIADRINMEAYHNSPTKESTSPVATNPLPAHITADEVAKQLDNTERTVENVEEIFNPTADEKTDVMLEASDEHATAISNDHQERASPVESSTHPPEAYELHYNDNGQQIVDAMTTSVYQEHSDNEGSQSSLIAEPETTTKIKEWDNGDEHIKETVTRSEFTDGNTHQSYSETVTVITEKTNADLPSPKAETPVSPKENLDDNISTDSLIIHDHNEPADYEMTQSVYEPKEEIEEKEWDDGNKHVHEVISNVEHTDETGKHFTETVTTTTTVIKTGDDAKNNNGDKDDEEQTDEEEKTSDIGEDDMHGSNGNFVETVTTTSHTVTSTGLPEGGILVDDGDETNTSSL